jgi:hypothetical protein
MRALSTGISGSGATPAMAPRHGADDRLGRLHDVAAVRAPRQARQPRLSRLCRGGGIDLDGRCGFAQRIQSSVS